MKKLGDYKGEEAIELWGDLLSPIGKIMADREVVMAGRMRGRSRMEVAELILKKHKREAEEILLRIDPTPLNGLNIIMRVANVIYEVENSEETKDFFGSAGQEEMESASTGNATENTVAAEA